MKKSLTAIALTAGLGIGGIATAGLASAQGYGGEPVDSGTPAPTESTDTSTANNGIIAVQDLQEDGEANQGAEAGEREGRRGHRGGCSLDTAAEAIGIEADALRAALDDGQTIAEVAEANGVDPNAVVDAIIAQKSERVAEKVAAGEITQEEADAKLAERTDRTTDRVFGTETVDA